MAINLGFQTKYILIPEAYSFILWRSRWKFFQFYLKSTGRAVLRQRCWILPKSATLRRMPHSEIEVHCMKLTACKMALRKLTLKEFALLWFFSSKLTLLRPRRGNHRAHFCHKIFQCLKLFFFSWILFHKIKSKWNYHFFLLSAKLYFLIDLFVPTYQNLSFRAFILDLLHFCSYWQLYSLSSY